MRWAVPSHLVDGNFYHNSVGKILSTVERCYSNNGYTQYFKYANRICECLFSHNVKQYTLIQCWSY